MRFVQGLFTVALIALLGVSYQLMYAANCRLIHYTNFSFDTWVLKQVSLTILSLYSSFCSKKLRHRAASRPAGLSSALKMSRTTLNVSTVRALLA